MSKIRLLGKDTIIYGAGSVIKKIIGFTLLPFYTRALIPEQYGVLDTLATLSFFVAAIFSLGLSGATSRYFFIAENEEEKMKLLYTSAVIRMISYAIPLLFFVLFSSAISELFFSTDKYGSVIIATGFLIYFSSQQEIQSQIFRFYRAPVKFSIVTILRAVINPVSGILLVVVYGFGVLGATIANLLTSIITLVFAYFYFTKHKYFREFSWIWAKKMLRFGYPLIFSGILVWVNSVSDRFFLLHYASLNQIGLYSIGSTFAQPILIVNMALNMSATVFVFDLYAKEKDVEKTETKNFLTSIWHLYLAFAVSVASIISIFSYNIVQFITTPAYISGILAIPFLIFSQILYQSTQITGNGMTLREQSKPYFWIMLCAATVNVLLNLYFIPKWGFVGAGITTILSNIVYFGLAYFWSQKVFYIKRSIIKPAIYFIICLMISIFFPFYEYFYTVQTAYTIKIIALIIVLLLPFLLRLISIESILKQLKNMSIIK